MSQWKGNIDECIQTFSMSQWKAAELYDKVSLIIWYLNLSIRKGYISSNGRWFMHVFHVTDQYGEKLLDDSTTEFLEQSLNSKILHFYTKSGPPYASLELTGEYRPGLLLEIEACFERKKNRVE